MSNKQIAKEVVTILKENQNEDVQIEALTLAMLELDETKFDKIVAASTQQKGFEQTMLELIYPFLEKLSVLWLTGSIKPVHENFISHLIRQNLMAATAQISDNLTPNSKKFFLYLPPGEKQELSLLFMHYLLKKKNFTVIYLGSDTSLVDLKDAYEIQQPDFIFTFISETFIKIPVQHYVDSLSESFPESQILLTGYQIIAQNIRSKENVSLLYSLSDTLQFLEALK